MVRLRTAMDSAFWGLNVASPQALDGSAKAVPGDPFPQDGVVASRLLRAQQLSFSGNGFPLGIIPSYSPTSPKELGAFSLQAMVFKASSRRWWAGLIEQFRPWKLISDIKNEISNVEELELSTFKDIAKHFIDKALYSFNLCIRFSLTPSANMLLSMGGHGGKRRRRHTIMVFQKLPYHGITLEAAWPQLFIDHKGKYWEVPESISLSLSSLVSGSALRYCFGIHESSGNLKAVNATDGKPPLSLMPGLCARASISYEKIRYLRRDEETAEDLNQMTNKAPTSPPTYDVRLKEHHAAISGIIGVTGAAWIWDGKSHSAVDSSEDIEMQRSKRSPFNADLYGLVCYTFQHGKFRNDFGDLTRVDARLDMCSASSFAKKVLNGFKSSSTDMSENPSA